MLKKVFDLRTVTDENDKTLYYVVRNYKNGKSRFIGKPYKTREGAMRQVKHRQACHYDRYGTFYVWL